MGALNNIRRRHYCPVFVAKYAKRTSFLECRRNGSLYTSTTYVVLYFSCSIQSQKLPVHKTLYEHTFPPHIYTCTSVHRYSIQRSTQTYVYEHAVRCCSYVPCIGYRCTDVDTTPVVRRWRWSSVLKAKEASAMLRGVSASTRKKREGS